MLCLPVRARWPRPKSGGPRSGWAQRLWKDCPERLARASVPSPQITGRDRSDVGDGQVAAPRRGGRPTPIPSCPRFICGILRTVAVGRLILRRGTGFAPISTTVLVTATLGAFHLAYEARAGVLVR